MSPTFRICGVLMLLGSLAWPMPAFADDRSATSLLKEIEAIKLPQVDESRMNDQDYIRQFRKERAVVRVRRAELIGELDRIDPDNPRLITFLPVRWRALSGMMAGPDNNDGVRDLSRELDAVLAGPRSAELKVEASYIKAWIAGDPSDRSGAAKGGLAKAKAVDGFIAFAPNDRRGAELLYFLSFAFKDDPARQKDIYARIVREYPEEVRAKVARGLLGRLDAVGKALDLTFNDAISGAEVSTRRLRGKILVVDFWATWCGPCVAEIPRLKELYAKYHDQGVVFLGVSLDYAKDQGEDGLEKLKAFVAQNQVPWPQYFQGDAMDSEFSRGLGINSIPAVFLVDPEGKIFSSDAGENLEPLILELLKRRAAKADVDKAR